MRKINKGVPLKDWNAAAISLFSNRKPPKLIVTIFISVTAMSHSQREKAMQWGSSSGRVQKLKESSADWDHVSPQEVQITTCYKQLFWNTLNVRYLNVYCL